MTNLHEAPDVSTTLSETDLSIRRFRGASYDEALAAAECELGEHLRVIGADRIRRGGLGGFFATDLGVEVAVIPTTTEARSAAASVTWLRDGSAPTSSRVAGEVSDREWSELMRQVEADAATIGKAYSEWFKQSVWGKDVKPILHVPPSMSRACGTPQPISASIINWAGCRISSAMNASAPVNSWAGV